MEENTFRKFIHVIIDMYLRKYVNSLHMHSVAWGGWSREGSTGLDAERQYRVGEEGQDSRLKLQLLYCLSRRQGFKCLSRNGDVSRRAGYYCVCLSCLSCLFCVYFSL